jgi:hypothetical protein
MTDFLAALNVSGTKHSHILSLGLDINPRTAGNQQQTYQIRQVSHFSRHFSILAFLLWLTYPEY